MRYNTCNRTYRNKKKLKGTGISVTESLTARRMNMLEKAREEYTFNNVWLQDDKIIFFDKNTNKVKTYFFFFFRQLARLFTEKKSVFSTAILLRSFLLVSGIFYIFTYYLYQILGNATLIVKIHPKNTLSIITKQYFLSSNFQHYSLTEVSTSIKHTNRSCSGMGEQKAPSSLKSVTHILQ